MSVYRCLTCGFTQDFEPTPESVVINHPWMAGLPVNQCPACTKYVKEYGGRKNGKVEMPDISSPGQIKREEEVSKELGELNRDFHSIHDDGVSESELKALKEKYEGKKLFGWSVDDCLTLKEKRRKK